MTDRPDVIKLFGGPGCGKTTTMVGNNDIEEFQGILQRMYNEDGAERAMLITYTRSAADEAQERLEKLTDVNKSVLDKRIRTIHSLVMGFNSLWPEKIVELRWGHNDKQNFCRKVGLQFESQNDDDDDDIMAVPDDEGHLFFRIVSWLRSNQKLLREWEDCPVSSEWPYDGERLRNFANDWENFKRDKGIYEFDDVIQKSVREGHTVDATELFVDEVQDLYPLQQAFLDNQFEAVDRIWMAGDDDQCLPPDSQVECRESKLIGDGEEYSKPIKEVEKGDLVKTATGDGQYSWRRVNAVHEKPKGSQNIRTFTTETGRTFEVTDNHKLFTRIPEETIEEYHYVYLMRDDEDRWRIGTSNNLRSRMNVERNARCIVPLEVCETSEEALAKEKIYSMEYQVPSVTFTQRGENHVTGSERVKELIYDKVDPDIESIEDEHRVFLNNPPYFKKSTTRGRTESININIKMCASDTNPRHLLYVYTSNEEALEKLREVTELKEAKHKGGGGGARFRCYSDNLQMLGDVAQKVADMTDGDIITQMSPVVERENAVVTPAGNIAEGMLVPVADDGDVYWEEVTDIDDRVEQTEVYDLTVDGTHNFTTNNVVVHNTIYEWAGANPDYFVNMETRTNGLNEDYWDDKSGYWAEDGVYILDQSWRMPNDVLDVARTCIDRVDDRQEKEIKPHHEGGEFITKRFPDPEQVIELINTDDTFILFRANFQCNQFGRELIFNGIPFTDRFKTWRESTVRLRDAIAALKNGEDEVSGEVAAELIRQLPDHKLNRASKRDDWSEEFESESVVGLPEMVSRCRDDIPDSDFQLRKWLTEYEDMNWFQQQGIHENIQQDKEHLYPDGVTVETIHWSKGKEADTVILSTDTTTTVMENMPGMQINDAERRLLYVGMTRTKNRLVMCEGLAEDCPSIPIDAVIDDPTRER